jgi:hypothetical protein
MYLALTFAALFVIALFISAWLGLFALWYVSARINAKLYKRIPTDAFNDLDGLALAREYGLLGWIVGLFAIPMLSPYLILFGGAIGALVFYGFYFACSVLWALLCCTPAEPASKTEGQ